MAQFPQRKSIRLPGYDYSQPGYYFITFNVYESECLLGEIKEGKMYLNDFGQIVEEILSFIPNRYPNVEIDKYVIMPNHVHAIIVIMDGAKHVGAIHESPRHDLSPRHEITSMPVRRKMLLSKIIGYLKMNSAKKINLLRNAPGYPVWQRNYYERIISDENAHANIWEYIDHNPDKWPNDRNGPGVSLNTFGQQ